MEIIEEILLQKINEAKEAYKQYHKKVIKVDITDADAEELLIYKIADTFGIKLEVY